MSLSWSDLLNPAPNSPNSPNSSSRDNDRRVSRGHEQPFPADLPQPPLVLASLDSVRNAPIEGALRQETHTVKGDSEKSNSSNTFSQKLSTPSAIGQVPVIHESMSTEDGSTEPSQANGEMETSMKLRPDKVDAPVEDSSEAGSGVELEKLAAQAALNMAQPGSNSEDQKDDSVTKLNNHSLIKAESEVGGLPATSQKPRPKTAGRSTTKDEGMHSDKRYLCYLCNKLFTRRRSVRDHISKIHSIKTWDPTRSLEIIVDPSTGECVEPLEKQIEKAGHVPAEVTPPPPLKPPPLKPLATLKTEPPVAESRASSVDQPEAAPPIAGKKRPAPAPAKKGMARIKSVATPHKKVKLSGSETITGTTPTRSPSATPVSISKKTPTAKLAKRSSVSAASSPTPSSRSASVGPSEGGNSVDTPGTNDDGEIFCVCRKGDNHTWMIACDGGCDEWFHGNCVNIRERDGDLIDKYICPNCRRDGYQTTWKRMCRRAACRKPARVLDIPPSKYCSPECGRKFFVEMVQKSDPHAVASSNGQYIVEAPRQKKYRKKRSRGKQAHLSNGVSNPNHQYLNDPSSRDDTPMLDADDAAESRSEYETDSSLDDDLLPNRGTALRAGEIKAIVARRTDIDGWRELGNKPPAPSLGMDLDTLPPPLDPTPAQTTLPINIKITYTPTESRSLADLKSLLTTLRTRFNLLSARESFLELIKTRSSAITDDVRKADKKNKDPCGFDPRLSWTEEEFLRWSETEEGKEVLASKGKIGPPPERVKSRDVKMNGMDGPEEEENDEGDSSASEDLLPTKGGVCVKSRCVRHRNWQKAQLAEIRFEQDLVSRRIEKLEREEAAIADRAVLRAWEDCPT